MKRLKVLAELDAREANVSHTSVCLRCPMEAHREEQATNYRMKPSWQMSGCIRGLGDT